LPRSGKILHHQGKTRKGSLTYLKRRKTKPGMGYLKGESEDIIKEHKFFRTKRIKA
jgi:hypothetical protein